MYIFNRFNPTIVHLIICNLNICCLNMSLFLYCHVFQDCKCLKQEKILKYWYSHFTNQNQNRPFLPLCDLHSVTVAALCSISWVSWSPWLNQTLSVTFLKGKFSHAVAPSVAYQTSLTRTLYVAELPSQLSSKAFKINPR